MSVCLKSSAGRGLFWILDTQSAKRLLRFRLRFERVLGSSPGAPPPPPPVSPPKLPQFSDTEVNWSSMCGGETTH